MFERRIQTVDIESVVQKWDVVVEYSDDSPFQSHLLLGFDDNGPLHIVVGVDENNSTCYIITVYRPDKNQWQDGYKRRIES